MIKKIMNESKFKIGEIVYFENKHEDNSGVYEDSIVFTTVTSVLYCKISKKYIYFLACWKQRINETDLFKY